MRHYEGGDETGSEPMQHDEHVIDYVDFIDLMIENYELDSAAAIYYMDRELLNQ